MQRGSKCARTKSGYRQPFRSTFRNRSLMDLFQIPGNIRSGMISQRHSIRSTLRLLLTKDSLGGNAQDRRLGADIVAEVVGDRGNWRHLAMAATLIPGLPPALLRAAGRS